MSPMLEKIARAAEEADITWAFNPDGDRFEQIARAALLAMREPDLAMRKVSTFTAAERDWPAMIDAILAGETEK